MFTVAVSVVLALLLASFAEWAAHKYLMHRPSIRLFGDHHAEHLLHHHRYYRVFCSEPDPAGRLLNLTFSTPLTATICLLLLPLAVFGWPVYLTFAAVAVGHNVLWSVIHSEMHLNAGRWFTKGKIGSLFARWSFHHFLHHCHPSRNYNVVIPLCDFLFGTQVRPTQVEREQWAILQKALNGERPVS